MVNVGRGDPLHHGHCYQFEGREWTDHCRGDTSRPAFQQCGHSLEIPVITLLTGLYPAPLLLAIITDLTWGEMQQFHRNESDTHRLECKPITG